MLKRKRFQKGPKHAPGRLQDVPKTPDDCLFSLGVWPGRSQPSYFSLGKTQDATKTSQVAPKTPQDAPKKPPIGPKKPLRRLKKPSKSGKSGKSWKSKKSGKSGSLRVYGCKVFGPKDPKTLPPQTLRPPDFPDFNNIWDGSRQR